MRLFTVFAAGLAILTCARPAAPAAEEVEIHVAAANLTQVLPKLAAVFERESHIHVIPSYGATAQLSQQAESGAPWDVFLAADTLKSAGLWDKTNAKIVYAPSVAIAKQFADTGNGDAAFTAMALVLNPADKGSAGNYFPVPENLHKPIDQAMCVMKSSTQAKDAQAFFAFMKGASARAVLERFGYAQP
jgi:ABC-type molybdate transport system substrate-binding protein